ncbi:hypothetical protein H4R35_004019 [Dimargaris xerosporica]|nr:hypothetical protein H4R35_004019 [Dimargaris xerosporica]
MSSRAHEAVLYHVLCDKFGYLSQHPAESHSSTPGAAHLVASAASPINHSARPVVQSTVPWRQALAATLEHDRRHAALITAQDPTNDKGIHTKADLNHSNGAAFDHIARLLAYQCPLPRTCFFAEDMANATLLLVPPDRAHALPIVSSTVQPATSRPAHVLTRMAQQGLAAASIIRMVGQFADDIPLPSFHRLAELLDAQGDLGVLVDVLRDGNSSHSPPTRYRELWSRLTIVLNLVPDLATQTALLGAIVAKRIARYGFCDHETSPPVDETNGGWNYEQELTVALNQVTASSGDESNSNDIVWHFPIDSPRGSLLALTFVKPWATVCRLVDEAVSRPSITPHVIAIVARLNIAQCRQQQALASQPYHVPFLLAAILDRADYWVGHGPRSKDYSPIDRLEKLVLAMVNAANAMSDEPSDHQNLTQVLPPPLLTATDVVQGLFGELIHSQGLVARPGAFTLAVGVVHALGRQVRSQSYTWTPQPFITDSFARQFLQQWSQGNPWKFIDCIVNLLQSEYSANTCTDHGRPTLLSLASFRDQLYDIIVTLLYTVNCFSGGSEALSRQSKTNAHQLYQLMVPLPDTSWPVSLRLAETVQPWLVALGLTSEELTWYLPRTLLTIAKNEKAIQWASNVIFVDEPLALPLPFSAPSSAGIDHSEAAVFTTICALLQVAKVSPTAGSLVVHHLQGDLHHYSTQVMSVLPRCICSAIQHTTKVEHMTLCAFVQEYLTWYAATVSDFDAQLAAAVPGWELLFAIDHCSPLLQPGSQGWLAYQCLFMGAISWGLDTALSTHTPTRMMALIRPLCQALQLGPCSLLNSNSSHWMAWPLDQNIMADPIGNQGEEGHAKLLGLLLVIDAYHRTVECLLSPSDRSDASSPVTDTWEPDLTWSAVQRFVCEQLQVLMLERVDQLCAALSAGGTTVTPERITATPAYQLLQTRLGLLPNQQLAHTIRAKLNSIAAGSGS